MESSEEAVFGALCAVLKHEFGIPDSALRSDATLAGDLDLDSLDAVSLEAALADRIGREIELGDPKQLRTLADVVHAVARFVERSGPAPERS